LAAWGDEAVDLETLRHVVGGVYENKLCVTVALCASASCVPAGQEVPGKGIATIPVDQYACAGPAQQPAILCHNVAQQCADRYMCDREDNGQGGFTCTNFELLNMPVPGGSRCEYLV